MFSGKFVGELTERAILSPKYQFKSSYFASFVYYFTIY